MHDEMTTSSSLPSPTLTLSELKAALDKADRLLQGLPARILVGPGGESSLCEILERALNPELTRAPLLTIPPGARLWGIPIKVCDYIPDEMAVIVPHPDPRDPFKYLPWVFVWGSRAKKEGGAE